MRGNHKKNTLIFERSDWGALASLCVPSVVSVLVMLLYNMADMYFVAWMGDVAAVAAVSLANPVFSVLMAVSTMLGNGCCTRIAQALGRRDTQSVRVYTALCVWGSLVLGTLFAAACLLGQDPLLRLLGANEEMWAHTRSYVLILAAGAPVILLNHTVGSALRGEGEVKVSLAGNMVATLSNILLDPLFILGFGWGVGGAAAATVLGNLLAVVYYWAACQRKGSRCVLELSPAYAADLHAFGGVMALGLPNAISSGLSGFVGTFSNRLLVGYGTGAVAAMAAAGKTNMLTTMAIMGICMGAQPLLAYCCGGQNWPRLKAVVFKLVGLTVALGTGLTVSVYLFRGSIVALFLKDPSVASLAAHLVLYKMLMGPVIGLYYISTNFLQAGGNAPAATLASALRQGILLVPLLYGLNALFGLEGLASAHVASDALAVALAGGMAMRHYKKISVQQRAKQ